jgi:hypothetical protein
MSTIEQAVVEKIRMLPPEQQQTVLEFVESMLRQQTQCRMSILKKISERSAKVPDAVWAELPPDGAEQHDHYLYGAPRK